MYLHAPMCNTDGSIHVAYQVLTAVNAVECSAMTCDRNLPSTRLYGVTSQNVLLIGLIYMFCLKEGEPR
jgi:uncharacterized membrane protein